MNLLDYGRIILRRGWIAILLASIVAVSAYVFSQIVTPVYRGTQTVLLVPVRSYLGSEHRSQSYKIELTYASFSSEIKTPNNVFRKKNK